MIRIVLADDHQILLAGLKRLIESKGDMEVVATAIDATTAIEAARTHRPDVLVLDISMPGGGLEVARRVREMELPTKIVILTMYAEDRYVMEAVRLGAAGYVLKRAADKELIDAIRAVHAGQRLITRQIADEIAAHAPDDLLSARELEVLARVAAGSSNKKAASELAVSEETVKAHMKSIMSKLGANDRTHAVTIALKRGMIRI